LLNWPWLDNVFQYATYPRHFLKLIYFMTASNWRHFAKRRSAKKIKTETFYFSTIFSVDQIYLQLWSVDWKYSFYQAFDKLIRLSIDTLVTRLNFFKRVKYSQLTVELFSHRYWKLVKSYFDFLATCMDNWSKLFKVF
jgi:hypothetical protein